MTHQVTLSIPDKDYLFFMDMVQKLKLKIKADVKVSDNSPEFSLSKEQKDELELRLEEYFKNPNQGSEWKDVKNRLFPTRK